MTRSKLWARRGSVVQAALGEGFFEDRPGDKLGGAGGDGGFDEDQAGGGDFVADGAHGGFQGGHVGLAGFHVAQVALDVVALDVHDDAVGQGEAIAIVGGGEGFGLGDAAADEDVHLGILGFDGGFAAVEEGDFPEAAGAGALAADDEFVGPALFIAGVGDDGGHDGADKAQAHDDDDFFAFLTGLGGKGLHAGELGGVIFAGGDGELFAGGAGGGVHKG